MRILLLVLILLSIHPGAPAAAQPASTGGPSPVVSFGMVEGVVVGDESGAVLPTATVSVWSLPDSVLVTGTVTDGEGTFAITELDAGLYYVQVSFVGYAPFRSAPLVVTRDTPSVDLDVIRLAPDSAMLGEVEVTAERAEVAFEIDRTVYSTRDQIVASGGNATDLLQNIPSIEVDVDGNISLRGNQSVGILINGKPAPARGEFLTTFLQQIPAELIDRVEVLPNPSAKYDPEGMAGMINIVLRDDAEIGTSGGVTLSSGTADEVGVSGNLNLQKGAWTVFTNYGYRAEGRTSTGYNYRENRYLDPLTAVEQDSDGRRQGHSHVGSVSVDYALSKESTLSASALVSARTGDSDDLNRYLALDDADLPTERFDRVSLSEGEGVNMDFSAGYRRTVEPSANELTAEVRYNRSTDEDLDAFEERQLGVSAGDILGLRERSRDRMDVTGDEWIAQVDWIRPVAGMRLETGYRGTLRTMGNALFSERLDAPSGAYLPDLNRNNAFDYTEQVQAGYALLGGALGPFEAQAGLRTEWTATTFDLTTTGAAYDNDYLALFPSAVLSWKATPTQQLKLSYSKRVNRPRTSQLNPFTTFTDPLNLYVGNPFLLPEYTHSTELAFQRFWRSGSVSVTPYFRRTVNEMERYKTVNPDGTSTLTFRNFDRSDSYGAEVIGSLRIGRALRSFASFNAYRVVTDASSVDEGLGSDALTWSARANLTWTVREGLDVQAFYFYRAPRDVAQGRISSFSVANLSIRQMLWGDRASLSLRVSDPLDRMGFRFELDNPTFYQLGERKWESRRASLTFTYNFGQAPKQKGRRAQDRTDDGMDMGIN